jgi:hypothetical protein
MEMRELTEAVLPSEVFAAVSYDPETREVGIQYGYVLLSLPREDFASFLALLHEAQTSLEQKAGGKSES